MKPDLVTKKQLEQRAARMTRSKFESNNYQAALVDTYRLYHKVEEEKQQLE